jgi:hypothetical protein
VRPAFCAGLAGLIALVIVVPAAPAAISVGQIPDKPSAVAAQTCAAGTFGVTSTAVPPRYEIPGDGVLTSWRTYTGAVVNQGPVRLKVIRAVSPTSFTVVAASAYITPIYLADGNNGPFATRIPVVANDLVALGVGPLLGTNAPYCLFSGGGAAQSRVKIGVDDPPNAALALPWDAMPTYNTYRVSVSASLEPDLDHDGYGDETQDRCPMDATTHGSCAMAGGGASSPAPAAGPGPAPVMLVSQRIAPTTFPAGPSGQSVRSVRGRYGTTVTYTLNVAAFTRFTVTRLRAGRKTAHGRCVASTRRNRSASGCTRRVTLPGHFTLAGQPGANSFAFTGRIGGKRLKPGRYGLVATPTANGQTGQPISASFRIVK